MRKNRNGSRSKRKYAPSEGVVFGLSPYSLFTPRIGLENVQPKKDYGADALDMRAVEIFGDAIREAIRDARTDPNRLPKIRSVLDNSVIPAIPLEQSRNLLLDSISSIDNKVSSRSKREGKFAFAKYGNRMTFVRHQRSSALVEYYTRLMTPVEHRYGRKSATSYIMAFYGLLIAIVLDCGMDVEFYTIPNSAGTSLYGCYVVGGTEKHLKAQIGWLMSFRYVSRPAQFDPFYVDEIEPYSGLAHNPEAVDFFSSKAVSAGILRVEEMPFFGDFVNTNIFIDEIVAMALHNAHVMLHNQKGPTLRMMQSSTVLRAFEFFHVLFEHSEKFREYIHETLVKIFGSQTVADFVSESALGSRLSEVYSE